MLQPLQIDLVARRNADFKETINLSVDGVAIDLTSLTLAMQIRDHFGSTGTFLLEPTVTVTDPADGIFVIDIPQESVDSLPITVTRLDESPSYVYDIRVTYPDGFIEVLMEGKFTTRLGVYA